MFTLNTDFGRKVERRIQAEQDIWLTTSGEDGTPQPRPVWFWWDGETFLIYSQTTAHKVKHIQKNPNVALNFNEGGKETDVVVFIGTARIDPDAPPAHQHKEYFNKYRSGIKSLNSTPEQFSAEYPIAIRVTPKSLRGW
jgi:PPOX class probable F420-dependent enzyme